MALGNTAERKQGYIRLNHLQDLMQRLTAKEGLGVHIGDNPGTDVPPQGVAGATGPDGRQDLPEHGKLNSGAHTTSYSTVDL